MAGAITTIPQHYTTEFDTNWSHLAQQMESRLKGLVTVKKFTGKNMRFNRVHASNDPAKVTERAGATKHSDLTTDLRWVHTNVWDDAKLIDEWDDDLLGEVAAPDSDVMKAMFSAFERQCDRTILDALLGSSYTGEKGMTTVAFDSGQDVAVNHVKPGETPANSNLTIPKLIKVKSLFGQNEVAGQSLSGVSTEQIYMAVRQSQLDSLLYQEEVRNADYNTIRALVAGEVDTFLGIKFVRTEQVSVASDVAACPAWVPSGINFCMGERRTNFDQLAGQSHALQVRVRCREGAVRMEENRVVRVHCDETA